MELTFQWEKIDNKLINKIQIMSDGNKSCREKLSRKAGQGGIGCCEHFNELEKDLLKS